VTIELGSIDVIPSPDRPGRVRLVGDVAYDSGPVKREQFWFEVAEEHAASLSRTGNPWLVCLAPLAATLGERIRLCLPVDRVLYRNVREVLAIWRAWYPTIHPVEIEASTVDPCPEESGPRSAAFFSGGVDSFFTVVRSAQPGQLPVDDLLLVGGFDIPLSNPEAFERHRASLAAAASELGMPLVDVVTNLRQTRLKTAPWGRLWHACGLGSVGLALENRYRRLLIAATWDYATGGPHGSHPLTDALLGTSGTRVLHDGATHTRVEKLELLATSPVALRHLHVCFRAGTELNCSACEKCLRTMAVLDVLGCLPRTATFDTRAFEPAALRRVMVPTPRSEAYYRGLRALAARHGRRDMVRAAGSAVRRSRWRRTALRLPAWLADKPGLWRAAGPLRRRILVEELAR
jgi:hypothetical protein